MSSVDYFFEGFAIGLMVQHAVIQVILLKSLGKVKSSQENWIAFHSLELNLSYPHRIATKTWSGSLSKNSEN